MAHLQGTAAHCGLGPPDQDMLVTETWAHLLGGPLLTVAWAHLGPLLTMDWAHLQGTAAHGGLGPPDQDVLVTVAWPTHIPQDSSSQTWPWVSLTVALLQLRLPIQGNSRLCQSTIKDGLAHCLSELF